MKKSILAVATTLAMLASGVANADVVISDWQTTGDNMVIYDVDNDVSWLSLRATDGMTYDEVAAQLDTTFAGWYLASNDQVYSMMQMMFPGLNLDFDWADNRRTNVTNLDSATLKGQILNFSNIFGNGVSDRADQYGSYYDEDGFLRFAGGYVNEGGDYTAMLGMENVNRFRQGGAACSNKLDPTHSPNGANGIWLVDRGGVEPSSTPCGVGETQYIGDPVVLNNREGDGIGTSSNVSAPLALGSLALLGFAAINRRKAKSVK